MLICWSLTENALGPRRNRDTLFKGSGSHLSFSTDLCGLSVCQCLALEPCCLTGVPLQNPSFKKVAQEF